MKWIEVVWGIACDMNCGDTVSVASQVIISHEPSVITQNTSMEGQDEIMNVANITIKASDSIEFRVNSQMIGRGIRVSYIVPNGDARIYSLWNFFGKNKFTFNNLIYVLCRKLKKHIKSLTFHFGCGSWGNICLENWLVFVLHYTLSCCSRQRQSPMCIFFT